LRHASLHRRHDAWRLSARFNRQDCAAVEG
jgi:hypothetical protein